MAFTKQSAAIKKPEAGRFALSVADRLVLLGVLPKENTNAITLRLVRDIQGEVGFSDADVKALKFTDRPGGGIDWNLKAAAAAEKEIHFGEAALGMIRDTFRKMNEENKLSLMHLPLFEKFEK